MRLLRNILARHALNEAMTRAEATVNGKDTTVQFTTGTSKTDPGRTYETEPFTHPVVTECMCGQLPPAPVQGELTRDSYPPHTRKAAP